MRHAPTLFSMVVSLAAIVPSQTTHMVGPGGLPEIRDALAIASPGDTILVQPGSYRNFTASIGVNIRRIGILPASVYFDLASTPSGCIVSPACSATVALTIFKAPPGQTMQVQGLDFRPSLGLSTISLVAHRVVVQSGRVSFEDCSFGSLHPAVLEVDSATVHLQRCRLRGEGPSSPASALVANNAHVTAVHCEFVANQTQGGFFAGGPGIDLTQSTFHGSDNYALGGLSNLGLGGPAVRINGGRFWLSDSQLAAMPGVCPVEATGVVPRFDRCNASAAPASCIPLLTNGPMVGIRSDLPLAAGVPYQIDFFAAPNTLVFVGASFGLATSAVPIVEQLIDLDPNLLVDAGMLVSGPQGAVSGTWQIPAGPAFVGVSLWFTGFGGPGLPIQATPVVGGTIY